VNISAYRGQIRELISSMPIQIRMSLGNLIAMKRLSMLGLCFVLSFTALSASADELGDLRENIEALLPGVPVSSVSETPVDGLYELIAGGQLYYVNKTGEYLLDGNLIQLNNRHNLTEARLGKLHFGMFAEIGEENMLIYEPPTKSNRSLTIFTDISCGFCRRLHAEIDTLMEEGVRVRYLLFPRAGLGSQGHKDLESVWCADDPQAAMTRAKAGGRIDAKSCDNPIESHVALAERVGLRGTPLMYLDSGERIPGYREATIIANMIHGSEPLSEN